MRKRILFLLLSLSMLVSCADAGTQTNNLPVQINFTGMLYDNGKIFFGESGELKYIDFSDMNPTVVCANPNCNHKDSSCPSRQYGPSMPFAYNDMLYWANSELIEYEPQKFKDLLHIYRSEIDGSGRQEMTSLEGVEDSGMFDKFLYNGILYFAGRIQEKDEYGIHMSDMYEYWVLLSYDIKNNTLNELCRFDTELHNNPYFYGIWNGKLYFENDIGPDSTPDTMTDITEKSEYVHTHTQKQYFTLDTNSGKVEEWDTEDNVSYQITNGWFASYSKGERLEFENENGEKFILTGDDADKYNMSVYNGYAFEPNYTGAVRLKDGKRFSVSIPDEITKLYDGYNIECYRDGKYIFSCYNNYDNRISNPATGESEYYKDGKLVEDPKEDGLVAVEESVLLKEEITS